MRFYKKTFVQPKHLHIKNKSVIQSKDGHHKNVTIQKPHEIVINKLKIAVKILVLLNFKQTPSCLCLENKRGVSAFLEFLRL